MLNIFCDFIIAYVVELEKFDTGYHGYNPKTNEVEFYFKKENNTFTYNVLANDIRRNVFSIILKILAL